MVYRDGRLVKIPASEVVAGDVFTLEAGDRVPCDGYINSSRALSCDESALTGEAVPAVKKCRTSEIDFTALNKDYMVYMGTVVTKGVGEVTAVATGERSQMGRVSTMLDEIKEPETPAKEARRAWQNSCYHLPCSVRGSLYCRRTKGRACSQYGNDRNNHSHCRNT